MMQQVATSNADIAALAANTPQSNKQDSTFTEGFGKLLQQHQDAHQSSDTTKKRSDKPSEQGVKPDQEQKNIANVSAKSKETATEINNATVVNTDKNTLVQAQEMSKEADGKLQKVTTDLLMADVANDAKNNTADQQTRSLGGTAGDAHRGVVTVSEAERKERVISDINELVRQFDLAGLGTQGADVDSEILASAKNAQPEESQAAQNEVQDWSSLVEKIQALALSGAKSTSAITAESKHILGEDVARLIQQTVSDEAKSAEKIAPSLLEVQTAGSQADVNIESGQSSAGPSLVNAVTQILSKIDSNQLNANSTEAEIQVDGLLNKLTELQALYETSKTTTSLGQGIEEKTSAPKITSLAADKIVAANNETQQQLVKTPDISARETSAEQLTDKLNQALIATVIAPASKGSGEKEVQLDSPKQNVLAVGQAEKVDGSASELELADVQAQPRELIPAVLDTKNAAPSNTLEVLANMSGETLDKSLNNLLQRMATEQSTSEVQKAQLSSQQAAAVAGTKVEHPAPEHTNKEFIAALKAGIDEFKIQLAQGREPGIDLKSLVAEAMSKSADPSATNTKQAEQTDIAVKGFSQVLNFAQQLNGALEQHQANILSHNNYMAREVGQSQLEQLKQFQTQTSQFDKAVNISKPEGHQQLAEKVRWMVNAKQLVAEIRLDPAELGSMQVKVSVTGESANISFVVQSQQARDAMENATPRLREMLAEKGIELGQSSVKQDQGQSSDEAKEQLSGRTNNGAEQGMDDADEHLNETFIQQPIVNGALGGIDFFV
jgi:flagellar hook-length control protein FliK